MRTSIGCASGVLISPNVEQNILKKLYKNNDRVNFKDILRERFRTRIKANRTALIDRFRGLNSDLEKQSDFQNTLSECFKDEIREFQLQKINQNNNVDEDRLIEFMKETETELIEEQCKWISEEYQQEENYLIEHQNSNLVTCPLCCCGILQEKNCRICCDRCNTNIPTTLSLIQFDQALQNILTEHSINCIATPKFCLADMGGGNTLCFSCNLCESIIPF